MDDSIQIIGYKPEYRDALIRLQSHLWGPDPQRNASYFDWKYKDNPVSDQTMITVVRAGERVVGMYGSLSNIWEAGHPSQRMKCVSFGDSSGIQAAQAVRAVEAGGIPFVQIRTGVSWIGTQFKHDFTGGVCQQGLGMHSRLPGILDSHGAIALH